MKTTKWVGLLSIIALPMLSCTAQAPPPPQPAAGIPAEPQVATPAPTDLSPAAAEVIKLSGSGVGEDVILAYVQNSQAPFNLSANHLLYLRDLGLSSNVVTAMLNRDSALHTQPTTAQTAPPPPPPVPEPAPQEQLPPPDYVQTAPPVEVNYFYGNLAPYGSWVVLPGHGWCWQPTAVAINRGWRPYCDGGHWVYSDCGWYWASDYSWGWAPFHYGRWFLHDRCGWVWTPDTVWAPAWVTWRVAGDSCGWAPLPPHAYFDARSGWRYNGVSVSVGFDFGLHPDHFTFVAVHDFTQHDIRHHEVPHAQVTKIYNQTTIVNNYTVNKNTIVNNGIAVNKVASATHTEIRAAKVEDLPVSSGHSFASRSFEKPGSVVYRPQLKAPPKTSTPVVAQKVDEQHPVIQHPTVTQVTKNNATTTRSGVFGSQSTSRSAYPQPSTPSSTPRATSQPGTPRSAPAPTQTAPAPSKGSQPPPVYSVPKSAPAPSSSSVSPAPAKPAETTKQNSVFGAREPKESAFPAPRSAGESKPAQSAPTVHAAETPKQAAPASSSASSPAPSRSSGSPFSTPEPKESAFPAPRSAGEPKPAQSAAPAENPHVYYPKSYRQAHDGGSVGQRQSSSGWPSSSGSAWGQQSQKGDSKKNDSKKND